ncbi:hypothetical protein VTN77DRAFT_2069 [Rasamsonia byssochlamydoides]|uniref:uncharacterized protein n=1 Tax=Rasamsonia byssochlamydoides TaxID=89139 RepID=UPI003743DE0C
MMSEEEEAIQNISSSTTIFLDQPPSCLEFCPADPDYFVVGTYLLSEERKTKKKEQKQKQKQDDGDDNENDGEEEGDENENDEAAVSQRKTGSLQLWKLDVGSDQLTQKQVISLPHAVFDLHFHPREHTLLAIATSAASVSLYRVARPEAPASNSDSDFPQIQHIWTIQVHEDPTTPALFLAWAPEGWVPFGKNADGFAVTFADGRTSVFAAQRGDSDELVKAKLIESQFLPRETIEAWFVALATFPQPASAAAAGDGTSTADAPPKAISIPFLFTGNDFGSLHTRRFAPVDEEDKDPSGGDLDLNNYQILNFDDKAHHHTAGVTSILPLPISLIEDAPLLLTGSYDEYIRVYHAIPRTKGRVLAERRLGGGVWRLQSIDTEEDDDEGIASHKVTRFVILASCMHAGTRIVRVTRRRRTRKSSSDNTTGATLIEDDEVGEWDIQILAKFTEHQSMNYASDFWKGKTYGCGRGGQKQGQENKRELVCVSSSFYDRRLCLWRVDI